MKDELYDQIVKQRPYLWWWIKDKRNLSIDSIVEGVLINGDMDDVMKLFQLIGKEKIVLVEGYSKKSDKYLAGRTDTNKVVIFPYDSSIKTGDYVKTKINRATSATLFGDYLTTIDQINYDVSNTA